MIISSFSSLAPYVPRLKRTLTLLVVGSVVAGLTEAGVLVVIVRVALSLAADEVAGGDVPLLDETLSNGTLLIIAVALGLLTVVVHQLVARVTAQLVSGVIRATRSMSIESFVAAGWERQSLEREGALQETATSLTAQSAGMMLSLAHAAVALLNLGALFSVALIVDLTTSLTVAIGGVALFVALRPIAAVTQRRAKEWVDANSAFAEEVTGVSSLALEYRLFGGQAVARERLEALNQRAATAMRRMRIASSFGSMLFRDIAVLLLIGAVAAIYLFVDGPLFSVGAVALLIIRSIALAQSFQANLQAANEQAPAVVRLQERLSSLQDAAERVRSTSLPHLDTIEFRSVTYGYTSGTTAVRDLDLVIERGEAVGVVGPSGSGKTTLAQLLLRLRPPSNGVVAVGGVDYATFSDADWTRLVALVPQEPRLLEASVTENIRFFRDQYDLAAVRAAAAAAHVLDDLDRLPHGFDTVLGPRGGGLSGGQRQRVTIARALLGCPELLVLDEPTSALDVQSERLLTQTITELKSSTTMLIIAHRLSTLESCDRIIVLTAGSIETIGTASELLSRSGFYQSIAETLVQPSEGGG